MNLVHIVRNLKIYAVRDLFTTFTHYTEQKSNSLCFRTSRRANIHCSFHGRRGMSRAHEKERAQCYPTLPEPKNWAPAKCAYGYLSLRLSRQWAHFHGFAIVTWNKLQQYVEQAENRDPIPVCCKCVTSPSRTAPHSVRLDRRASRRRIFGHYKCAFS